MSRQDLSSPSMCAVVDRREGVYVEQRNEVEGTPNSQRSDDQGSIHSSRYKLVGDRQARERRGRSQELKPERNDGVVLVRVRSRSGRCVVVRCTNKEGGSVWIR